MRMLTNQAIYFALLIVAALISVKFGFYPILIVAAALILLQLWSRLTHPRLWKGDGYAVRLTGGFREAWVDYEEAGRTLSLRAEWGAQKGSGLWVQIDEKVYFPPDFENPLSESRVLEIQKRISEGLERMKIPHTFARLGWTSTS